MLMTVDNYNTEPTQEELREAWESQRLSKIKRESKLISPLPSENLQIYVERLSEMMALLEKQAMDEHMYGKKGPWYVHKRAQNCFICDFITMNNQMLNLLFDLIKTTPTIGKLNFNHAKRLGDDVTF